VTVSGRTDVDSACTRRWLAVTQAEIQGGDEPSPGKTYAGPITF
jgi:hypothetical protein